MRLFFACLLLIPFVELYLFVRIGAAIGVLPLIGLCILTAMIGTVLVRRQGIATVRRVQDKIQSREPPAIDLLEGLILLVSGVLLLIPGFLTDLVGCIGLLPVTRHLIARNLFSRLQQRGRPGSDPNVVIDAEFWEEHGSLPDHHQSPARRPDG